MAQAVHAAPAGASGACASASVTCQTAPIARSTSSASTSARSVPASTPAASSVRDRAPRSARASGRRGPSRPRRRPSARPPSRSWPPSSRRSGPSTRASATSGGCVGEQHVGGLAEVRDLRSVGGRDERVAGGEVAVERADPDARALGDRLQRRRRCRAAANSSAAAVSSFSRLRVASARFVICETEGASVWCYIDATGGILRFTSSRRQHMSKVWFITGTSKGFGRVWAEAALERGDRVAATARNAPRSTDLVEPTATTSCRSRSTSPTRPRSRPRRPRPRALRSPRRRRQQRRLRPVRHGRGGHRGGRPRADRDEPVRRAVGDPGGAADPARAALGPHHPGVLDRRRERVPDARALPRVQVGAGGDQPGAGAGGRGLRDQRHARRAGRLLDRLVAARPRCSPSRCPRTRSSASGARSAQARLGTPGDPEATGPAILEVVDADEPPLRVFFGAGTAGHDQGPSTSKRIENWERWDDVAVAAHG